MRRWLIRLLLAFVLLIAVALIAAQLVLRSDLPRRLVIQVAEAQTGLHIDAASLNTGWLGLTTIHDLSVSLPLETQPLLTAPELRIEHAGLLKLLITRDPAIETIVVREPFVQIQTTRRGEWNLIEAAEQFISRQSGKEASAGADRALPKINITGGMIELAMPDGKLRRYTSVTVRGEPDGRGAWRGDIDIAPYLNVSTEFAPGGSWAHDVRFDVQRISAVIEPWLPDVPDRLHLTGRWQGKVRDGAVTGRLSLRDLAADRATISGELDVSIHGSTATVKPRDVIIALADLPIDTIALTGGRVRSDGALTTIEQLIIDAPGAQARIDGRWSREDDVATVQARWAGELNDGTTVHRGTLDARAQMPDIGSVQLTLHGHSEGAGEFGTWATRLEGEAGGEQWTALTGSMIAPQFTWSRGAHGVDLSGLTAEFGLTWPLVRIADLNALDDSVTARGRFDATSREWSVALTASGWQPSRRVQHPALAVLKNCLSPIEIDLAAHGTGLQVALDQLDLLATDIAMRADGSYKPDARTPLQLNVAIESPLERLNAPNFTGQSSTEATITGAFTDGAIELLLDGTTTVQHARWRERDIETVIIPWRSELREQQIDFETDAFVLLDGQWIAIGRYDFDTERASMALQSTGTAIDRIVSLIDAPIELRGELDLDSTLEITRFDPTTLSAEGTWQAHGLTAPMLDPADGRGHIDFSDGVVHLHETTISAGDRQLAGEARFTLDRPAIVDVNARSTNWPITIADTGLTMVIDGAIDGQAHLERRELCGNFDAHADFALSGEPLGWAELRGNLDAMTANIIEMHAELLNGTVDGGGRVMLDPARWMESTVHLDWANLDLEELATKLNRPDLKLEALTGRMHGRLAAGPSTDRRAPEPWQFDLSTTFDDAAYDAIPLGRSRASTATNEGEERAAVEAVSEPDMTVRGYAGAERVLIDAARLTIADGFIDMWGRVSAHGDEHAAHLHAELRDLDLQPFALVAGLDERPMPGRVSGSVSAGGYLQAPHRLFGGSRLSLRESDLAALPFISLIFDTLRLSFGQIEPTGKGEAVIRLEGDRLELSRLTYFNRGTDIVAQISVEDLTRGFNSPVRGVAAGGVRPLRDVELPFFDQLDRAIEALQSDAASVRIDGTVGALETRVVPFSEILGAIGRVLGGN